MLRQKSINIVLVSKPKFELKFCHLSLKFNHFKIELQIVLEFVSNVRSVSFLINFTFGNNLSQITDLNTILNPFWPWSKAADKSREGSYGSFYRLGTL